MILENIYTSELLRCYYPDIYSYFKHKVREKECNALILWEIFQYYKSQYHSKNLL